MRTLSKEERARKFGSQSASKSKDVGLRSRGHKKLSFAEQKELFNNLSAASPTTKLDHLRIIREAIQSSKSETGEENDEMRKFHQKVLETSILEAINQKRFDIVPQLLAQVDQTNAFWNRLFIISCANIKRFHQAFQLAKLERDEHYISCIVNMDVPLWNWFVDNEKDQTIATLMNQVAPEFTSYNEKLETSLAARRPKPRAAVSGSG